MGPWAAPLVTFMLLAWEKVAQSGDAHNIVHLPIAEPILRSIDLDGDCSNVDHSSSVSVLLAKSCCTAAVI